jgi:hypothetical protein
LSLKNPTSGHVEVNLPGIYIHAICSPWVKRSLSINRPRRAATENRRGRSGLKAAISSRVARRHRRERLKRSSPSHWGQAISKTRAPPANTGKLLWMMTYSR